MPISPVSNRHSTQTTLSDLPVDLKREIIETIVYVYPRSAVQLALVSSDVQNWVEQVIYKELYFTGGLRSISSPGVQNTLIKRFLETVEVRPASFFAERVKTIHFNGHFEDDGSIHRILTVCSGVKNLGFYPHLHGMEYELVHWLSLERLFVSVDILREIALNVSENGSSLDHITHLAVVNGFLTSAVPQILVHFPNLTHLAFRSDHDGNFISHLQYILSSPMVKAIVILVSSYAHTRDMLHLHQIKDSRIIIFTLPSMPLGDKIFFEDDIWDLAAEFPDEDDTLDERYLTSTPLPIILPFSAIQRMESIQSSSNNKLSWNDES